jgi:hypothetical protein
MVTTHIIKTIGLSLGITLSLTLTGVSDANSEDIMMLPLHKGIDAKYRVELKPTHVTQRDGYDNQPKFGPDGKSLYFTRQLDKAGGEGLQTDIFKFDIDSKDVINVTQTEDISEYSPTPYNADFLSTVRVNPEGEQHLSLFNTGAKIHEVIRSDIEPVGYFAWLQPTKAAVFVLGDVMTLQILDTESEQQPLVLEEQIGRCFETVANNVITFSKEEDGIHQLYALTSDGAISSFELNLPQGVQDYVWVDSQHLIVGQGSKLFMVSSAETKELADLSSLDVDGITRLALSPDKSRLALVYQRP